jgi:hypothetical protein
MGILRMTSARGRVVVVRVRLRREKSGAAVLQLGVFFEF